MFFLGKSINFAVGVIKVSNQIVMNNPFEYVPDAACEEAFRKLVERIEALKRSDRVADMDLCRELEAGELARARLGTYYPDLSCESGW